MMSKYLVRVYKRPSRLWVPGTDYVREAVRVYRDLMKPGDIIVFSEKAVSVSMGLIYDESRVKPSLIDEALACIVERLLWLKLLNRFFERRESIELLLKTPLKLLAKHKKSVARMCSPIHILKPFSECGVDATNLPYQYVALPLKNAYEVASEARSAIESIVGFRVNVLIVDSDLCFKPRGFKCLAIATRDSCVKGIVNLGGVSYLLCKVLLRKMFLEFPTPVAYDGFWYGLEGILKISRLADKAFGPGVGVTLQEASSRLRLGLTSFTWRDLASQKHYPVVLVRVRKSL